MGVGEELRLVWFVGLNVVVLATAWRVASRLGGRSMSAVLLDTLLLNYLIEYSIVCGLGACGELSATTITYASCGVGGVIFLLTRCRGSTPFCNGQWTQERRVALFILMFAAGYLLSYAMERRSVPVLETDALAYHLPTAIGWLQSGRLRLFEAWYWNPANTYSPLAGEAFMAWLIAPMQSNVFVRFVQMPALLMVGLAMYRIGRQICARPSVAALAAIATMLSRSIFAQATLVKDDLFVVAFFITAIAAMGEVGLGSDADRADRGGSIASLRVGVAVGLLVAMKYPALLTLPVLLLMMPVLVRKWSRWQWILALSIVALLAGPWFVRNGLRFGNPLFPMIVHVGGWTILHGIFNVSRDATTRTPAAVWAMATQGYFGTPGPFLIALIGLWMAATARFVLQALSRTKPLRKPAIYFAIAGPVIGPIIFSILSPHPEVRYFFPFLLPLFVAAVAGLQLLDPTPRLQLLAAGLLAAGALSTSFRSELLAHSGFYVAGGIAVGGLAFMVATYWIRSRRTIIALFILGVLAITLPAYVKWRSYVTSLDDAAAAVWPDEYGPLGQAWIAARDHLPAGATIAYANTNLIYPLFDARLQRRVVYAPARPGERTFSDLPVLGDQVPQDRIVETVTAAMNSNADAGVWIANLRRLGVTDAFIATHQLCDDPPELRFAREHPAQFLEEFRNSDAVIYHVK